MFFTKEKKEYTIKIEGMKCMHCVKNVENTLSKIKGIKKVDVSLEENCAKIVAAVKDEANLFETIKTQIEEAGFSVLEIA